MFIITRLITTKYPCLTLSQAFGTTLVQRLYKLKLIYYSNLKTLFDLSSVPYYYELINWSLQLLSLLALPLSWARAFNP